MSNIKLSSIYYSPKGFLEGIVAIKQLAAAAKVTENVAPGLLKNIWQICLLVPRNIPRPQFVVNVPNEYLMGTFAR